jgi:low molecular weight protein-tyrosine phosphatase
VSRLTDRSTFDVVFVCTANRARSALSEALYRRYALGFDTRASSFGTLDVGQAPALGHAVEAGRRLGVDLSAHTAVALSDGVLARADLVLGFEPHHVAAAVIDGAAEPGRTFLLREFVELLEPSAPADGTINRARAEVAAAYERRTKPPRDAAGFVIPDPAGRSPGVMVATATEIDELVRRIVRDLFGSRARA